MNLIEWINGVTKLNKATMDTFQNNIKESIDEVKSNTVHYYSEEEKVIGYWINGKPIYQKVIKLSEDLTIEGLGEVYAVTLDNAEVVINAYGSRKGDANSHLRVTPLGAVINPLFDTSITVRFITVEYTKTTDAGTLISFTIGETTYQAEDGMTWQEWVNSSYNTDAFRVMGTLVIFLSGDGYYVGLTNSSEALVRNSDSIQSGYAYVLVARTASSST